MTIHSKPLAVGLRACQWLLQIVLSSSLILVPKAAAQQSIDVEDIARRASPAVVTIRNLSTTMGHSTGLIKEQFPVWRGVWWED